MYSIEVACPNCHKHFQVEFEDGTTHASKGIYVRCDHCGVEKRLAAFQRELKRQAEAPLRAQKSADKARRAMERREQREQRRTQRAERKSLAQKEAERKPQVQVSRQSAPRKPVEQVPVQRIEAPQPPPPQQQMIPTVNVNIPRRTSSLGVASLVLGIVAFLICWIPFVGVLGIPVSGLGLLLGLVGLVVAIGRRGAGIGFPIAGSAICGLALAVGMSQVAMIGAAADSALRAMEEPTERQNRTSQATPSQPHKSEEPAGSQNRTSQSMPRQPKKSEEPEWASARSLVRHGDVGVKVAYAYIGKVSLEDAFDGSGGDSKDDLLSIGINLTNHSQHKKVEYRTWTGRSFSLERDYATLRDNFDNLYKRINFGFSVKVVGRVEYESIYPGETLSDVLVFEKPVDAVEYLNLALPAENFGGEGMLRIRIPADMIGDS